MERLYRWGNILSPRPKDPESAKLSLSVFSCLFSFSGSGFPEPKDQHISRKENNMSKMDVAPWCYKLMGLDGMDGWISG